MASDNLIGLRTVRLITLLRAAAGPSSQKPHPCTILRHSWPEKYGVDYELPPTSRDSCNNGGPTNNIVIPEWQSTINNMDAMTLARRSHLAAELVSNSQAGKGDGRPTPYSRI
jgi:hypothetical protein